MNTAALVWVTINLWFGSLHVPVRMSHGDAAVYEMRMLKHEAEELKMLVLQLKAREERRRASIPHQNEGRAGL